jgi:signal transduction histidine kinase
LTPRRRAVLAILLSWAVGYFYVSWAYLSVENLARYYHGSFAVCDSTWRTYLTSCSLRGYNPLEVWSELIGVSLVMIGLGFLAARWVMHPVRQAAESVAQFGPTSLGLRLPEDGPKDEMRWLSRSVNGMLARLAEGYEAQRRFASTASHELRTPLATQRALIEVSLSSTLTPDGVELLSRQLLSTNERNERLIDGLLTLAETDGGLLSAVPIRLDAITADILTTFRSTLEQHKLSLSASIVASTVIGEAALVERLVTNLVQNAIKYNRAGGAVVVAVQADGVLRVANTGPMLGPEVVPGLFEPFRRVSGERLDHGGGVGLGLTIVRSIVNAHHGSIEALANADGGLTVVVRLPQPDARRS